MQAQLAIGLLTLGIGAMAQDTKLAPAGKYAEVNGLRMYYEIQGEGEPVVLLHGAFGNTGALPTILQALVKSRKVITLDFEGHGRTRDLDRPLNIEQMADDTAGLLKHLNLKDVDVFGYSMGGSVALGIAIRHPDLVRRVAFLGSNAGSMKDTYEPASYQQFLSLGPDFAPPVLKEPYERMAPDPKRWPILVEKIAKQGREFKGFSAAELKAIRADALIMQGDRDGVRPEHAVEIFRLIPKAQLVIFPGGDHFMPFHSPERILEVLVPFLNGVKPKSFFPLG